MAQTLLCPFTSSSVVHGKKHYNGQGGYVQSVLNLLVILSPLYYSDVTKVANCNMELTNVKDL